MKALVIGGIQSGSGKTTVALGLAGALRQRGLSVQAFKVGPDFLDPTYLEIATGRPVYNLDIWMTSEEYVRELFIQAALGCKQYPAADVCIIEGVMGLYDGVFVGSDYGSTASLAKLLGLPVLLLSSCKAMARSFAALVSGFCNFSEAPEFLAVGANMAGSERHIEIIRSAVDSVEGLPPFAGALPKGSVPELTSRHLGLISADKELLSPDILTDFADAVQNKFAIDMLLAKAVEVNLQEHGCKATLEESKQEMLRIGIARDDAFHFYYSDNLAALTAAGCELVDFSPLTDLELPKDLDALYLGGGYPECKAAELAANTSLKKSICEFAASGRVIYAECGGLMYLSKKLVTQDGNEFDMCGLFPVTVEMLTKFKTLGYVEAIFNEDNIFGKKGGRLRGHEYHYSHIVSKVPEDWQRVYNLYFGRDIKAEPRAEGFAKDGILLSYLHANFVADKKVFNTLLESIRKRTAKGKYEI